MQYISAFILLLFSCTLQAQEEGIIFSQDGWEDILAKAQNDKLIIFVDAYTTWCGPCKMMDQETFKEKEVGQFYNTNFLNVKMDMEKDIGPEIAKKYEVKNYPSFLFLNSEGELINRGIGYMSAERFILLGKMAIDDDHSLETMSHRYEAGDRDPEFLRTYTNVLAMTEHEKTSLIANEYLLTQNNWDTPEVRSIIYNFCLEADSQALTYLFDNRPAFDAQFGEKNVRLKLSRIILSSVRGLISEGLSREEFQAEIIRKYPQEGPRMMAHFQLTSFSTNHDWENYKKAAVDYYETYQPDNFLELDRMALMFYEHADEPELLKTALAWAQESVETTKIYMNMNTLAALYFKTGDKKKGRQIAYEAIEIAKKTGTDYGRTETLLKKYK